MAFSLGGNENATYYRNEANNYPDIRIFTVGQKTSSRTPLMDLQTIGKSRHPCNRCSSGRSPNSVTILNPIPVTTLNPISVTTPNPIPVTTLNPIPAAPLNPISVTTLNPRTKLDGSDQHERVRWFEV